MPNSLVVHVAIGDIISDDDPANILQRNCTFRGKKIFFRFRIVADFEMIVRWTNVFETCLAFLTFLTWMKFIKFFAFHPAVNQLQVSLIRAGKVS